MEAERKSSFIKKQSLLLIAFIITVLLIVISFFYYRFERETFRKHAQNNLHSIAELKAGQITKWFVERSGDAGTLSESPFLIKAFRQWIENPNDIDLKKDIEKRLNIAKTNWGYENIFIASPEGDLLLSLVPGDNKFDPFTSKSIIQAIRDQKISFTDFYFCTIHKRIHFDIIAPVVDKKKTTVTALVFRIAPSEYLYPLIQSWPLPSRTAETVLVRKEGESILHLNELRHRKNTALKLRVPLTEKNLPAVQAVTGYEGIFEGKDYRGVEVLADVRHVPGTSWYMISKIDKKEIYSELYYRALAISVFTVMMIMLLVAGTSWLYYSRQKNIYEKLFLKEKNLREAQEEFRTTLYSIGDAVITTDTGGFIRQMNPVAEALTGWKETEAKGKLLEEVFQIINEETLNKVENPVQRVLREGIVIGLSNHTILISKDGKKIPIADSGSPIHDNNGSITGVVLVFRDQTEERAAQKALLVEKTFSDTIINSLPGIFYLIDENGNFLKWNRNLEIVSGYSSEEIKKMHLLDFISGEQKKLVGDAIQEVFVKGESSVEANFISKDGRRTLHYFTGLRFTSDKKPYLVGMGIDITEPKRMEEALIKSQQQLRKVIDGMGSNTFVGLVTPDGIILEANRPALEAAGLTLNDVLGKPVEDTYWWSYSDAVRRRFRSAIKMAAQGKPVRYDEQIRVAEAQLIWIDFSVQPLFDENGKIVYLVLSANVITERKKMELELRNNEALLSNAMKMASLGYWEYDVDKDIFTFNDNFYAIFRTTTEQVGGYTMSSADYVKRFIHPEDKDIVAVETLKAIETDDPAFSRQLEHRIIYADGEVGYITVRFFIEKDEKGRTIKTYGVNQDITERKRSEEILRESEEKYHNVVDRANDGIVIIQDGIVRFVNRRLAEMWGGDIDEVAGTPFIDFVHPDSLGEVTERYKRRMAGEPVSPIYETTLRRKDGSKAYAEINAGVISYEGNPSDLVVIRDITERKQAEESLHKEKIFSDVMINSLPGIFYLFDEKGHFMRWNSNFETVSGYSSEEIEKIHPLDLFSMEGKKLVERAIQEVFAKGESHVEADFISKDGSRTPYYLTGLRFFWDNKAYLVGMGIDITERILVEQEVHNSYFAQAAINMILSESLQAGPIEEFLQKALNIILSIPWLAFEAKGSLHLVEEEQDVLVMKAQYNLPEPLKKLCAKIPFGKCLCGQAALTQKTIFTEHIDESHSICYEGMESHGHYIVPVVFGRRTIGVIDIYLKEGHIKNSIEEEFLRAVSDTLAGIIARRQAEEDKEKLHAQLLQAQKMEAVGQLAGGIAHDFNNILTAMIGYGYLLKTKMREYDPLKVYAEHILSLSDKAANLTQSLLAFSRKQIINPRPVDINEIIRRIDHLLSRIIGEDIQLQTILSDKDLIVMADSVQIEQVLMNLATNARDAMPGGGLLSIKTEEINIDDEFVKEHGFGEKGKFAILTLADTGAGMDRETLEKIFEPFFTTKEVGKGTGLGLAMVYGIIKQHKGYINVYSELGKGTTFRIYLPLIKEIAEQIGPEAVQDIEKGTETVLLAEDQADVREISRKLLEDNGYQVITAIDGQTALDKFNTYKDKIQLVILDVIMPVKSGKEVYDEIMKIKPEMKVLFISGYPADIIHKQGIIEKGLAYIEKPASPAKLLKKIREVLTD